MRTPWVTGLCLAAGLSSCDGGHAKLSSETAKSILDTYYGSQCAGDKPYDRDAYGSFELFVASGPQPPQMIVDKYHNVDAWLDTIKSGGVFVPGNESNRDNNGQGEVIREYRRSTKYGLVWIISDKYWNMNEITHRVSGCLGFPNATIQDITRDASDPKGVTVTYSLGIGGLDGASVPAPPELGNYVGIRSVILAPRQGQYLRAHFRNLDRAGWTMDEVGGEI